MRKNEGRSAMQAYLSQLKRHPPLDRDEELVLAQEYRRTGSPEVARRLVCGHLRLVVKIALEHRFSGVDLVDLIAEGNVGLLIALGKYEPERGVRLSTYASWWIRALVRRYVMDNRRLVRIGTTARQRHVMRHLREERARLERDGLPAEAELLAERLGVPAEGLAALAQHLEHGEVALDAPAGEDAPTRLAMLGAPGHRPDELVERAEADAHVRATVDAFLGTLPEREQQLFRARFLEDEQPTLQELGRRFGFSRERARQIEEKLIGRFRAFAGTRLAA
jgi:RNA polymerase sigma-32 factor